MVMTAKTKMFTMVLITKTDNGNDDYHGYNDGTDHDEGDYDVMRAQDRS